MCQIIRAPQPPAQTCSWKAIRSPKRLLRAQTDSAGALRLRSVIRRLLFGLDATVQNPELFAITFGRPAECSVGYRQSVRCRLAEAAQAGQDGVIPRVVPRVGRQQALA